MENPEEFQSFVKSKRTPHGKLMIQKKDNLSLTKRLKLEDIKPLEVTYGQDSLEYLRFTDHGIMTISDYMNNVEVRRKWISSLLK